MKSISLADLDLFANGAPWDVFKQLRDESPMHWNEEEAPQSGFYSVTRYHDIVKVLRDPDTFTSERFTNLEEVDAEQEEARRSLLETDGSRHRALRRILQGEFTPQAVAKYETFLRGLTATTLDKAFAKGSFDFVEDVAADFPINVLVRLLDVPEADAGQLIDWGNRMIGFDDPEHADVLINSAESEEYRLVPFKSPAALEVFAYGDALAKDRRGKDGTDLISRLVNTAPSDGIPLSERDFHTNFLLLIVAGNETTRHTISHTMRNLINNPDQLAYLQENPDKIE
ncbi:MAG: cytochrome P450, partial [Actinobacteria bacterium]|nr:cytochrome P450 [Actinomycetota bacterium]